MNRGIPVFALLFSAILAVPSPALAQREERHEGAPQSAHHPGSGKPHPQGKPQGQPHPPQVQRHEQPHPPQVQRHEQPRRHEEGRPPERAHREPSHPRPPAPERVRPEPTPRPEWKTTRVHEGAKPMLPAPERRDDEHREQGEHGEHSEHADRKPLKPAPITDPKRFVRRWNAPPAPDKDANGGAWTAKPVTRPPLHENIRHFDNPGLASSLVTVERGEREPNRYYWHRDGDLNYVHCYRGGQHWYGFNAGGAYFWTRYHAGRWWWYDPGAARYVYYYGGNWWWQDPAAPQVVYVYENNAYVQYAEPAPAENEAHYFVSNNETLVTSERPHDFVVYTAPAEPPAPLYSSDVDSPTYSAKPDPNRFAIVVGVENYATLPAAEFAARDAGAMRAHLRALGYPDRNVVVLTSSEAARASVAKYVEAWLPERVTDQSRVFVYFSGHGAPDPKTGAAYLMPWDGDAKYLANTGYPLKQLYASLNALPAKELVVVLDSCFSGLGGRSVLVAGARPLVANVDVGRGATGRVVVFSATGNDEITGTLPQQGHGLFTYWFLKGLNGEAAGKDGVTVQALYDYLAPNVEDAARRDNRDQTPQLLVPPDGQRKLLLEDLR